MSRCQYCSGDGKVTLLRRTPPTVSPDGGDSFLSPHIIIDRKEFPCPACQPYVPVLQLQTLDFIDHHRIPGEFIDQMRDEIHRRAAWMIGEEMEKQGTIKFREHQCEMSPYDHMIEVHARAYVAPADHPAIVSMEQRIRVEALQIVDRIINEAMRRIRHWGSHYHAFNVPKDVVGQTLREEYRKHSEGRK